MAPDHASRIGRIQSQQTWDSISLLKGLGVIVALSKTTSASLRSQSNYSFTTVCDRYYQI